MRGSPAVTALLLVTWCLSAGRDGLGSHRQPPTRPAVANAVAGTADLVQGRPGTATAPAVYPDREFDGEMGGINDLAFSADGRFLAAVGPKGLGVWDAQAGTPIRREAVSPAPLLRVAFGPQGTLLAAGAQDGRLYVMDLRTGIAKQAARHAKAVSSIAFAADERTGASGDEGGDIVLWDPVAGNEIGRLTDDGHRREVLFVGFTDSSTLVSVGQDLRVITWDVLGKRARRRGTLQSETFGRRGVPTTASLEAGGTTLAIASQDVVQPRGGVLGTRGGLAHPDDLTRVNQILPYRVDTGTSADPVRSGEFLPERLAVSPGGCLAFFTSSYRDQPRLHIWSIVERGDDLLRTELKGHATALTLDARGRTLALGFETGEIRIWRVSGASAGDCQLYRAKGPLPTEPSIILGSETSPLIPANAGYRVAVLNFEAGGVEASLGAGVAEMIAGELANSRHVVVVERDKIQAIVKELELQRSGLTTADAVRIGRGLNARKVVFGSVRRFGENVYVIQARIVDIETQQVEGTREVRCENCGERDLPRTVEALRRTMLP